jgi:hypothetical protein
MPLIDFKNNRLWLGKIARHLAQSILQNDKSHGFTVGVKGACDLKYLFW